MDYFEIERAEVALNGAEYVESITPYLVETVTDWNMFIVAIIAGVISAIATVLAVLYTQWKTSQQYEAELRRYKTDKEQHEYEKALVIIKPSLKFAAIGEIRDS